MSKSLNIELNEEIEEWEMDYLKYDGVSSKEMPDSLDDLKYMYRALRSCKRDFIYSVVGGVRMNDYTEKLPYMQLWRTGHDIRDVWDRSMLTKDTWAQGLVNIWESHPKWHVATGPGAWADPDMLVVGWVGWGPALHYTRLTPNEQYTHITLWCLLASPLLIGCDLNQMDPFTMNLLTNDEVLAVNQDPLGKQAVQVYSSKEYEVWVRDLADGSKAVGLFNKTGKPLYVPVEMKDLQLDGKWNMRDVWTQSDLGKVRVHFEMKTRPHGARMVVLSK